MRNWEAYGPPAVRLEGFRLWVHGYQFPESTDAWDGNWLWITAHCAESGASVVVSGAILDTVSFLRFHRELTQVYERLEGMATLESHEPELKVEVLAVGQTGRIDVRVEITPDHMNQAHRFLFTFDQTYLPEVLRGCQRVLGTYPVRNGARAVPNPALQPTIGADVSTNNPFGPDCWDNWQLAKLGGTRTRCRGRVERRD